MPPSMTAALNWRLMAERVEGMNPEKRNALGPMAFQSDDIVSGTDTPR
jgi:hypothetical protein